MDKDKDTFTEEIRQIVGPRSEIGDDLEPGDCPTFGLKDFPKPKTSDPQIEEKKIADEKSDSSINAVSPRFSQPYQHEPKVVPHPFNTTQVALNKNLRASKNESEFIQDARHNSMSNIALGAHHLARPQTMFQQRSHANVRAAPEVSTVMYEPSETSMSYLIQAHNQDKLGMLNEEDEKENAIVKYWRSNQDPQYLHQIDRRLEILDDREPRVAEVTRFNTSDVKGQKKTMYIKQVMKQNDCIQTVAELDKLELLINREDRWPCQPFRKSIQRIRIQINLLALNIIKRKSFEAITILIILANCTTLTMSKADVEPTETEMAIENVFQGLYTVEMLLKILGQGFVFNQGAYMRDSFNILDFFIVMSAYLSMMQEEGGDGGLSLSSLRAFRVLKPLRAVNNIPGLRLIVQSILSALPLLKDTIIVLLFFFLIFAIGGVNLFSGMLRQRCIEIETGDILLDENLDEVICGQNSKCDEGYFCGKRILNPNYDVTSFDNIFWALLAIFQCVTLEGWSDMMVLYQKVFTYYVFLFFVPLVFIGAFFLLNLTLAVINTSFNDAQERLKQQKADQEAEQLAMVQSKTEEVTNKKKAPKEGSTEIGITQFFTAKRAARRMREFAQIYHQQKQLEKDQQNLILVSEVNSEVNNQYSPRLTPRLTPRTQRPLIQDLSERSDVVRRSSDMVPRLRISDDRFQQQPGSGQVSQAVSSSSLVASMLQIQSGAHELVAKKQRSSSSDFAFDKEEKQNQPDMVLVDNQTITEEEVEDGIISRPSVQEFLQNLQNINIDQSDALLSMSDYNFVDESWRQMKPLSSLVTDNNQSKSTANMVMAFNDLRRANAHDISHAVLADHEDYVPTERVGNSALERIRKAIIKKEKYRQEVVHKKINLELDYDRVIENRKKLGFEEMLRSTANQDSRQPDSQTQVLYLNENEHEHEYDLSFIYKSNRDVDEGGAYLSDIAVSEKRNKSMLNSPSARGENEDSDFAESVILSDSSIASAVEKYKKKKRRQQKNVATYIKKSTIKGHIKKDMGMNLQRRLTSNFDNRSRVRLQDQDQDQEQSEDATTNFGAQSVKQQIDIYSSLNAKASVGVFQKQKESERLRLMKAQKKVKGSEMAKAKAQQARIYKNLDVREFDIHKNDPYAILDRKRQKIVLNPGVDYESTSQNDVFELRHKKIKSMQPGFNQFVKVHDDSVEIQRKREKEAFKKYDEDELDDMFIKSKFQPYQLKRKLNSQKADEVHLEDDDEDALVLQQQPYETVMQVSKSDLLNHLSTKFITRRSDIIVSSTLSITLTPLDNFKPTQFLHLEPEEIANWVEARSDFRALYVNQAQLNDYEASEYEESDASEPSNTLNTWGTGNNLTSHSVSQADHSNVSSVGNQATSKVHVSKSHLKLPRTLLSNPIPPDQVMLLSEQDKRDYNIQRQKYELEIRKMLKQEKDQLASVQKFSLEEARQLITGEFWDDEEEEEKRKIKEKPTKSSIDKKSEERSIFLGRGNLDDDMRLDQFEVAIRRIVNKENEKEQSLQDLQSASLIPESIRREFNLPEDQPDVEIDFQQVRLHDIAVSNKHQVWSGQEILSTSLNSDQAEWVTQKISSVRVWPKGKYNYIKKFRALLKMHCMNPLFENSMTFCVLLNTVVMSMDKYGQDKESEVALIKMNEMFTWIFIYEMSVKLLAIGPKKYTSSKWNLLDGGVVLLSIMELIVETTQSDSNDGGSSLSAFRTVKVFRTFRVMRVARILRALHSMQVIIGVITRSFRSFMYVVILLFLFVFIYALLGIQIYQGKYDFGPNEELPRGNFEDFGIAFVTVFQVLTMENWQEVMYASMRSARGSTVLKALTAIFYVSWIFIGNFILLNLFLAILIDSFNSEESETSASHEEHQLAEQKASEVKQKQTLKLKIKRMKKLGSYTQSKSKLLKKQFVAKQDSKKIITFTGTKQNNEMDLVEDLDDLDSRAIRAMLIKNKVIQDRESKNKAIKIPSEIECENSIYIFNRKGCFRKTCYYIQQHKYFDRFIMFLIAVSSFQLAFETYIVGLPEDDPIMIGNTILGQIFTYLFMLEFLFKLVALGLIMENGSYLRESWNILDFFIVMTSLVDQMLSSSDIAALKILRMLRILRPLRVVSHNVQLKMIVIALLDAGGSILNVIIVVLVVWLMFAIFAVNTYKGHFFYCSIEKYDYSDKYECETKGGEWMRYDSNFDNVGQAMMTLFIVSSLEGWPNIMNQAMDITKEDRGPAYQGNVKQAIFFIVFILIGSFFFLNFFIGVLFLKYSEAQKREVAGFTEEQLFWSEMQVMILNAKVPHNAQNKPNVRKKWKTKAYNLVTSHTFEVCIIFIIFLNMLQMALQFEGSSESYNQFMEMTNFIFTAIFIVEAILKLFAFGWSYFGTSWNKFDFFVVISSILDISLTFYQDADGEANEGGGQERQQSALSVAPQLARVLRVLRVSRVLRIAGHYKGLQSLFNTIMYSVSALINVFMLLMLFFFILATLGQFMFNGVKEGQAINEYKNFQVFDRSFLLLFSISTGEDWNRIMYDCSLTAPDCVPGVTCGSEFAPVYFIAFILLVTYVMLNLFILVIIQQFQKLYLDQGGPLQLFARDYEIIVNTWVKFTTRNRCRKLKEKFLQEFLKSIPAPLGLSDKNEAQLKKEVLKMGFKSEEGFIYFNELLYRILRNQYGCFKLNTKMQIAELITQFKLFNLTMKSIKQDKIDIQERFLSKVGDGGKDSFNPFLTQMYYRISFLAWFNLTRRRARRIAAQAKTKQQGNEKVDGHFFAKQNFSFDTTQDEVTQYEAVEIEVDHFSEYSVSSEEEDALADPTGIPLKKDLDKSSHKKLHLMQSARSRDVLSPPQSRVGSQMSKSRSRREISFAKLKSIDFRGQLSSTPNFQINDGESRGSKITNKYLSPQTNSMIQKLFKSKKPAPGMQNLEDQLTLKSRQSAMGFATTSEIVSPMVKPSLFSKLKRAKTLGKLETRQPVSPEHQTEGSRKDLTLQIEEGFEGLDDD